MDEPFFSALLDADARALDTILTDDFILVDVMAGGVIPRNALIGVIASGEMTFTSIELQSEPLIRHYGECLAISVGETRMTGTFGEESWSAHSRFTHVFVRSDATWHVASAQGTGIVAEPASGS